jgi:hypothetical protein
MYDRHGGFTLQPILCRGRIETEANEDIPGAAFFCPVSELGPSTPSPPSKCCPPTLGLRGETHSIAVEGGGGQFRRKDRHSGTLCIL